MKDIIIMTPRTKSPSFANASLGVTQEENMNKIPLESSSFTKSPYTSPLLLHAIVGLGLYAVKLAAPSYWLSAASFIEVKWNTLIDYVGLDDINFWVWGTVLYTFALYWAGGLVYLVMDLTGRPKVLRKYKVQPEANDPPDYSKLRKLLGQVLFNQTVVTIPLTYIGGMLQQSRHPPLRELPSLGKVFIDFVVCMIVFEAVFYYSHRLLHHPRIYKRIHKIHHEWTSPIALGAIYCHPIEHVFSNLLPQIVGLSLMRSHVLTSWLWFTYVLILTLSDHSGYHLPFFPSPEYHDYHHLMFNGNYGGGEGFFDWLHGTDVKYRATLEFQRSHVIMGLSSARELHPNVSKKQD
ncbi:hypothetical protein B566_EDAN011567 [Ephemera danica]|nr:hypothetical protein B566_EDAN011567 [Ephemera danica]